MLEDCSVKKVTRKSVDLNWRYMLDCINDKLSMSCSMEKFHITLELIKCEQSLWQNA